MNNIKYVINELMTISFIFEDSEFKYSTNYSYTSYYHTNSGDTQAFFLWLPLCLLLRLI